MKRRFSILLLSLTAAALSYLYSDAYIHWNVPLYLCAVIALFITATLSFLPMLSAERYPRKKRILFSLLGGAAYAVLHFTASFFINVAIFHNEAAYLTAVLMTAFNAVFFATLSAFSIDAVKKRKAVFGGVSALLAFVIFISGFLPARRKLQSDSDGAYVYQDTLNPDDLKEVSEMHVTDRLYRSRWGVFIHYLYGLQNNPAHPSNMGVGETDWNACVEAFDVDLLARQLHACGAHFLFITLMQGSRYMIAPNETYNKITGMRPGEACADRDLVLDLYNALEPYGIDLYLYSTGDGPHADEICGPAMGYVNGTVSMEFVENWASVMQEYALRYGDKVKGWWFDGCYRSSFGYTDALLAPYYQAIKAGNPNAVVAFNDGVANYYKKNYTDEDFVCGEFNYFNVLPRSRFIDGAQAFLLAPLGEAPAGEEVWSNWASPGARYTGAYMRNFIACANEAGGVVAIDVGMQRDGSLYPEQLAVLQEIEQ